MGCLARVVWFVQKKLVESLGGKKSSPKIYWFQVILIKKCKNNLVKKENLVKIIVVKQKYLVTSVKILVPRSLSIGLSDVLGSDLSLQLGLTHIPL